MTSQNTMVQTHALKTRRFHMPHRKPPTFPQKTSTEFHHPCCRKIALWDDTRLVNHQNPYHQKGFHIDSCQDPIVPCFTRSFASLEIHSFCTVRRSRDAITAELLLNTGSGSWSCDSNPDSSSLTSSPHNPGFSKD